MSGTQAQQRPPGETRSSRHPSTQVGRAFLDAIEGIDDAVCFVPGLGSAPLAQGLSWIDAEAHRGWQVDYRVDEEPDGTIIWLKSWDPEEQEPDWPEEWPEAPDRA